MDLHTLILKLQEIENTHGNITNVELYMGENNWGEIYDVSYSENDNQLVISGSY